MQLATAMDNQPWVCNLHFYADDKFNLYWISTEARLHSQHVQQNPKVATALLVHENTADEDYVIGLSVIGNAVMTDEPLTNEVGPAFVHKHGHRETLLSDIKEGKNAHRFYKLSPTKIVLFDSKNFPADPRQIIKL